MSFLPESDIVWKFNDLVSGGTQGGDGLSEASKDGRMRSYQAVVVKYCESELGRESDFSPRDGKKSIQVASGGTLEWSIGG